MNNEPVALMTEYGIQPLHESALQEGQFLYTHPIKCNKCNDTEWVCENHPDQEAHKCIHCGGAGKPCECTHPVKEQDTDCQYCKQGCIRCDARKQLTDEEITSVFRASSDYVEFARAIMKRCGIISGTDK